MRSLAFIIFVLLGCHSSTTGSGGPSSSGTLATASTDAKDDPTCVYGPVALESGKPPTGWHRTGTVKLKMHEATVTQIEVRRAEGAPIVTPSTIKMPDGEGHLAQPICAAGGVAGLPSEDLSTGTPNDAERTLGLAVFAPDAVSEDADLERICSQAKPAKASELEHLAASMLGLHWLTSPRWRSWRHALDKGAATAGARATAADALSEAAKAKKIASCELVTSLRAIQ